MKKKPVTRSIPLIWFDEFTQVSDEEIKKIIALSSSASKLVK